MGVPQLQQLDCPFHIGQTTAAEFGVGVRIRSAGQPLGVDPRLDPTDLQNRGGRHPAFRIAHRVGHQHETPTEFGVTGYRTGPQQGLDLPRLRPLRVVGSVGGQGTHQRPVSALRPKAGIDLQRRIVAGGADQRAQLFGHRHRPLHRARLIDSRRRLTDKHHVGIRPVTQLLAAESAHPDHRDHRRSRVRPGVVLDHRLQRALQHRHPHRRQGRAHCPDVEHAEQVRRGHPGQFPTAQGPRGGDGPERVAVAPGRGHQRPRHNVGIDVE